jgi:excisionase family DNA binding protein
MFLRPRQAAAVLGRSLPTIWKMLQSGKLDAVRDGSRMTLITMESIDRYAASLPKIEPGNTVPANIASKKRAAAKQRGQKGTILKLIFAAAVLAASLSTKAAYAQTPGSLFDKPDNWTPQTWRGVCAVCGPQWPDNACRQSFKDLCAAMARMEQEDKKDASSRYKRDPSPAATGITSRQEAINRCHGIDRGPSQEAACRAAKE